MVHLRRFEDVNDYGSVKYTGNPEGNGNENEKKLNMNYICLFY